LVRFVGNDALDAPSDTLSHLLFAVHGPSANLLVELFALFPELLALFAGEYFVHEREAVAVVEKVLSDLWDRHGNRESRQVRQDLEGRLKEFRLEELVSK
jgi:hypothetical protein